MSTINNNSSAFFIEFLPWFDNNNRIVPMLVRADKITVVCAGAAKKSTGRPVQERSSKKNIVPATCFYDHHIFCAETVVNLLQQAPQYSERNPCFLPVSPSNIRDSSCQLIIRGKYLSNSSCWTRYRILFGSRTKLAVRAAKPVRKRYGGGGAGETGLRREPLGMILFHFQQTVGKSPDQKHATLRQVRGEGDCR